MTVFWDSKAQRYRYEDTQRFVSREAVLAITERRLNALKSDLKTIGELLVNNKISFETWQSVSADIIKETHLNQAIIARGGADRMTNIDYLAVGRQLKGEYQYLRGFAQDIADGKLSINQFFARLNLYTNKSRVSAEEMYRQNALDSGLTIMQRFLGFTDRHCSDCIGFSAAGVQPIGELPLPTQECRCLANCKCRVEYS